MDSSTDMAGLVGDLLRLGTVESVDLDAARVVARLGDVLSPPCPWMELAGAFRSWCPPVAGEQILLLCPEGDIAHGVALRGIYSTAFPAPANDARARLLMPDGSTIDYDPAGHVLTIALAGGSVAIEAPGGVQINGDVAITGALVASDDVTGGGVSLKSHKHGGVQAGGAQSGGPA